MMSLFDSKEYQKQYYQKNKEKLNKLSKEYYAVNKEEQLYLQKGFAYKRKYGITQEDFDYMYISQGGVCAICELPYHRTLHVDHNHNTGKVRGLLCKTCNTHLGTYEKYKIKIDEYLNED